MEWWAFYFEYKCIKILQNELKIPGCKFGNVKFDLARNINWDLKSSAIKSKSHNIILNDVEAMNLSIESNGYHGEIIALCDVEYNDQNRTFQKWHNELKGGLSKYEKQRIERTVVSRYRKTKAVLEEILLLVINKKSLARLDVMYQGRNANGKPRKTKYLLNLEELNKYDFEKITLG